MVFWPVEKSINQISNITGVTRTNQVKPRPLYDGVGGSIVDWSIKLLDSAALLSMSTAGAKFTNRDAVAFTP